MAVIIKLEAVSLGGFEVSPIGISEEVVEKEGTVNVYIVGVVFV